MTRSRCWPVCGYSTCVTGPATRSPGCWPTWVPTCSRSSRRRAATPAARCPRSTGSASLRAAQRQQAQHRAQPDQRARPAAVLRAGEAADIVVDSGIPGQAAAFGTSCAQLADRFEHLVAMNGHRLRPEPVRTPRGRPPTRCSTRCPPRCRAPGRPPERRCCRLTASPRQQPRCRRPGLCWSPTSTGCVAGQAITSTSPGSTRWFSRWTRRSGPKARRRPPAVASRAVAWQAPNQDAYPIFACRDGYVRICVLAPRQWRGLRAWLGEPEDFQDPIFDTHRRPHQGIRSTGRADRRLLRRARPWRNWWPTVRPTGCRSRPY